MFQALNSTTNQHDVSHLRDRVRLYLQVMLSIDLIAYGSDYVTPLFVEGLAPPDWPMPTAILRWSVTVGVAFGWVYLRFTRPNRAALIALESAVTLGLVLVYIRIAAIHMTGAVASYGPIFAMFGIMLLLGVRAALVPSPLIRTVAIGLTSVVSLFVFGRAAIRDLDPMVLDGLTFIGVAYVVATAVTSSVIYGLRREIREAIQLGQYTLEEKLGQGGMGEVYRARHAMLRRDAAIKLIRPEVSGDGVAHAQAVQRFEREAQVTANLRSPHTIQLYDFGVSAEGMFYYVMELLDGVDLESVVAQHGPVRPDRAVHLLRQVCDSLAEAHATGLVHRDIKPANIFLCHLGNRYDFVKVLDFGLVGLGTQPDRADTKLTVDGSFAGTPAYVAPEMAMATAIDGRADVYALGCVAYWLLTGRPPFERDTAMATVLAHVNDEPLPPSSVSELSIPEALDALILACLAKSPEQRPASAAELSRRLAAAVEASSWDQGQAKRWWSVHRPVREAAPGGRQGETKLTRALDSGRRLRR